MNEKILLGIIGILILIIAAFGFLIYPQNANENSTQPNIDVNGYTNQIKNLTTTEAEYQ